MLLKKKKKLLFDVQYQNTSNIDYVKYKLQQIML